MGFQLDKGCSENFGKTSYSIEGEDLILHSVFRDSKKGFYIDIGSNHPIQNNNTYYFYNLGWRGICIDPNVTFSDDYKRYRPEDTFIPAAVSAQEGMNEINYYEFKDSTLNSTCEKTAEDYLARHGMFSIRKINTIMVESIVKYFEKEKEDKEIPRFLNLDIEGNEIEILKKFVKLNWPFDLIIIELKKLNLHNIKSEAVDLLKKSYSIIAKTPLNTIFIRKASLFAARYPREMI